MGGETNNGLNLSLVHHANVVFSGGAFLLILVVVMAFCLCRRGYCLQWVLGPSFLQQQGLNNGVMSGSSNTASIPTQAVSQQPTVAPTPVEVEIEHLKRSNQLLELQQRRSQLLALSSLGDQGSLSRQSIRFISDHSERPAAPGWSNSLHTTHWT